VLAVMERPDCCLAEPGLTLAEGGSLLAKVQTELISKQVTQGLPGQTIVRPGSTSRRSSCFHLRSGWSCTPRTLLKV
jgi:hypothetical protein